MSLVIRNGALVLPEEVVQADLRIENGRIAEIGQAISGEVELDAAGKLVFPGFVDPHTHFEMNKGALNETADDFASGTAAALAGGTTTILDFATQERDGSLAQALETWHSRAAGKCSCHYGFHMAITRWDEDVRRELPAMTAAGVTSYKLYFTYDALRLSDRDAFALLCAAAEQGALVSAHCENGDLVNAGISKEKAAGRFSPAAHPSSRPDCVEAEAISRWLTMGELAGVPVYVVHLSTQRGLELVRAARRRGQTVYVESCPQYILLNKEKYLQNGFKGAEYVCSPPLRGEESTAALTAALETGEVEILATDHCSFSRQAKELGREDFSSIPNGLPGVEHRPALLYSILKKRGTFDPVLMKNLLASNPSRLFGLSKKGELIVGWDADLVLWDPAADWTISAAEQLQRAGYTPYEGMKMPGRAEAVLLGGQIAARQGRVLYPNLGRYQPRVTVW